MNEFTKEELEMILSDLNRAIFSRYYRNGMKELREKLKLMIDNYCEHQCDHQWDGILISEIPNTGKCKKCGTICYIALKPDK